MGDKFSGIVLAVALASASGSACAMSSPARQAVRCEVIGGDKLPAETGGAKALCAAIKRAAAIRAPGIGYSIKVRVLSPSRLAATVTAADGRVLPTMNHAISDRSLSRASMERFAAAVAGQIEKTVKP